VDRRFRGLGLASRMIDAACAYFFAEGRGHTVTAHIKSDNPASLRSFRKAHFLPQRESSEFGVSSQLLVRTFA
ncbi:MAG: GNAT family N-acetyltransferase, partial [Sphingobacteriaceae bacterium]|nr:GNAT family N-acetyltransferase [Cytophagaceae bacterium]